VGDHSWKKSSRGLILDYQQTSRWSTGLNDIWCGEPIALSGALFSSGKLCFNELCKRNISNNGLAKPGRMTQSHVLKKDWFHD
jgi:hypothetical protein